MGEKRRVIRSDLRKLDAYRIAADEYAEMPERTEDQWDRHESANGDVVIRPARGTLARGGRPKSAAPKKSVHLRLSPDVLAYFRKTGPGWQTRIDEILRKAAKLGARRR